MRNIDFLLVLHRLYTAESVVNTKNFYSRYESIYQRQRRSKEEKASRSYVASPNSLSYGYDYEGYGNKKVQVENVSYLSPFVCKINKISFYFWNKLFT